MKKQLVRVAAAVCLTGMLCFTAAESIGKITLLEGKVSVLRTGAADWQDAKPNMPLMVGDQIYTRSESFAEIVYTTGVIQRMAEETKVTVIEGSAQSTKTASSIGNVWVNMRKLVSTSGKNFELKTPTATAAIRGTVFNAATGMDSSTAVSVYEGKVAVGPNDPAKKAASKPPVDVKPGEVPGPEEVPGPYEVTLAEWKNIIAGQRISVRKDGKFSQEKFDPQKTAATDAFVKKNQALDGKTEPQK